jgi:TonB family protein
VKDENAGPLIALSVMLLGIVLIGAPLLLGHKPLQSAQPGHMAYPAGSFGIRGGVPGAGPGAIPSAGSPAGGGQTADSALVTANNTAVTMIKDGKIQDAIDLLEPLVKTNPTYGLGRENLAIAYNNMALKQTDSPKMALDSLWRSYCLAPGEGSTADNINDMVKVLKKDPKKFGDRLALGDAQMSESCLYGAYAEYKAALKIRDDAQLKARVADLEKQAGQSSDDDVNGAFFVKMSRIAAAPAPDHVSSGGGVKDDLDYGSYMSRLQRSIKRHWFPPSRNSSQRTQVTFAVASDGTISNLKISKSSGDQAEDQAGLKAINDLGKADPLPPGSSTPVAVQFTFDYNVSGAGDQAMDKSQDRSEDKKTN